VAKTAAQVAQKWATNLAGSTASIQAGVQAVTVNPAQQAAAAVNQYLAGVQQAVADGSYVNGLSKVTLQSWQQAMLVKGVPRIASGATAAQPKFQAFMGSWLPYMQQLQQTLQATPRGDLQTNIQRAVTAMNFAAAYKGQGKQ
jgi:hypothetical protein